MVALSYGLNSSIQGLQQAWNPRLTETCRLDVSLYCQNIKAGKGEVGRCLLGNFPQLTESCQKRIYSLKLGTLAHSPDKYLLFLLQSFAILAGVFGVMYMGKVETNYKSLPTDFAFFVMDLLFIRLISLGLILVILQLILRIMPVTFFVGMESVGVLLPRNEWAKLVIYLIMVDLFGYISHRMMHSKYLWKFHGTHHSSTNLQWHSNFRNHPVNGLFQSIMITIPLILLGLNKLTYVFFLSYMIIFDAYTHSSVRTRVQSKWLRPLNFLRYIIVTPEFHRYHHQQKSENGRHQNYAGIFAFWDIIFGTSHFKLDQKEPFGVKRNYPETFGSLLAAPFRKKND
ncbi:MAG: sterol desaturase family protein [Bdellovibrionales bacterium]|nr:sterol desaturase family protein [Bdellovibrionales bacterium]